MAISLGGQEHQPLSDINVTPFVDVMLVLLVIFMVTAPLIHQEVNIDLPETRSQKAVAVKETDVVLEITKDKKISIEKTEVPFKTLEPKLREIFRSKKNKEIFLQADKTLSYGYVVKVMAAVKNAGIEKMGMITDAESNAPTK